MAETPSHSRGLSYSAAKACEEARETVCKCRCGGAMHGAKRQAFLFDLAKEDPHHVELARVPLEERPRCDRCAEPIGSSGFLASLEVAGRQVCELCRVDETRLSEFEWFKSTRPVQPSWPGTLHVGRMA